MCQLTGVDQNTAKSECLPPAIAVRPQLLWREGEIAGEIGGLPGGCACTGVFMRNRNGSPPSVAAHGHVSHPVTAREVATARGLGSLPLSTVHHLPLAPCAWGTADCLLRAIYGVDKLDPTWNDQPLSNHIKVNPTHCLSPPRRVQHRKARLCAPQQF